MVRTSATCSTCQPPIRGGGKCGKDPLGILTGCKVKRPALKVSSESFCPDKVPISTRIRATPQIESHTELLGPWLCVSSSAIFKNLFPVKTPSYFSQRIQKGPCYTVRVTNISTLHYLRKELYSPGCPHPAAHSY